VVAGGAEVAKSTNGRRKGGGVALQNVMDVITPVRKQRDSTGALSCKRAAESREADSGSETVTKQHGERLTPSRRLERRRQNWKGGALLYIAQREKRGSEMAREDFTLRSLNGGLVIFSNSLVG